MEPIIPTSPHRPRYERWVILALLLAYLTGLPGLFALPAERILFHPEAYKQALDDQQAYDTFPLILGDAVANGSNRFIPGVGEEVLSMLEQSRYEALMRAIFTEEWVRSQAGGLVDQFWAYFNFQDPSFQLLLDMRPVKERLAGPEAPQVASIIVDGLPSCNAEDLLAFALRALQGQAQGLPLCRPGEQFEWLANEAIGLFLQGAASALPDEINLASGLAVARFAGGERVDTAWSRGFAVYRFFRSVGPWLPWISLAFLVAAVLLARRTARGMLFWGGVGLVLPGVSAMIIALLLGLWMAQIIPWIVTLLVGSNLPLFQLLVDVISQVARQYTGAVLLTAAAASVVGAVLVTAGVLRR